MVIIKLMKKAYRCRPCGRLTWRVVRQKGFQVCHHCARKLKKDPVLRFN